MMQKQGHRRIIDDRLVIGQNVDEIQDGRDKISKCYGSHERDQRRWVRGGKNLEMCGGSDRDKIMSFSMP